RDRRDLGLQDPLNVVHGRTTGDGRFRPAETEDGRRDRSDRDARIVADHAGHHDLRDRLVPRGSSPLPPPTTPFEIAWAARVPTFLNHWRPRMASTSKATISSSGRRTV